jgi:type VI protein secretion system component Hcp
LPLIEGDSTDETHYYWSELRDCNFGFAAKDPEPEGADGASAKPTKQLDQVTLTKKVDWASTQLFQKCCEAAKAKIAKSKEEQGKGRIDQVTVEVCKTAGGVKFPFLIIKYYGVRVVDYAVSMSGPEPSETIKLEIEKFDFEYQPTDPYTGSPKGPTRAARGIEDTASHADAQSAGGAAGGGSGGAGGGAGGAAAAFGGAAAAAAAAGTGGTPGVAGGPGANGAPAGATSAAEAAANANFPGFSQGTGPGLLPD